LALIPSPVLVLVMLPVPVLVLLTVLSGDADDAAPDKAGRARENGQKMHALNERALNTLVHKWAWHNRPARWRPK